MYPEKKELQWNPFSLEEKLNFLIRDTGNFSGNFTFLLQGGIV